MKKYSIVIIAMICICMFSACNGESQASETTTSSVPDISAMESSTEISDEEPSEESISWRDIEDIAGTSRSDLCRYYEHYIKMLYPEMTEDREKCLKAFEAENPDIYSEMVKPLPVYLEDEEKLVIAFYRLDGKVYMFDENEEKIS